MTAQLALDLSTSSGHPVGRRTADSSFPDVTAPTLLRVVTADEGDHEERPAGERVGERLATVHRLFTDALAAEPTVVADLRRSHVCTEGLGAPVAVRRPVSPAVYRRRRLAVAVVLGLLVSVLSLVGGELLGRITGTPGIPVVEAAVEPATHVVQPGDTLWSIARTINPAGRDVRHTVDRLVEANGGPMLQPGQLLVLPVG